MTNLVYRIQDNEGRGPWRFVQERLEDYIREETERQTTLLKTAPAFTAPVEQRARAPASRRRTIPSLAI